METKPDIATRRGQRAQIQAASRKIFPDGHNGPLYPTYTNAVEFTAMGMDIFMDVGTVAPEAIQEALAKQTPETETPLVNLNVLYRFGMSVQTAIQLHEKLTELIQATHARIASNVQPTSEEESG